MLSNNYGWVHTHTRIKLITDGSPEKSVHSQQTKWRPMNAPLCSINTHGTRGKFEWKNQPSCSETGQMSGIGLYSKYETEDILHHTSHARSSLPLPARKHVHVLSKRSQFCYTGQWQQKQPFIWIFFKSFFVVSHPWYFDHIERKEKCLWKHPIRIILQNILRWF